MKLCIVRISNIFMKIKKETWKYNNVQFLEENIFIRVTKFWTTTNMSITSDYNL